jgi:hypothetical protein
MGNREIKKQLLPLLASGDVDGALERVSARDGRKVLGPLFSFLSSPDPLVKWTAVTCMGAVTDGLARENMEAGRVVLRRLMWMLSEESGGIGWGAPEAMGEILACSESLAREFSPLLISYARQGESFLEFEPLQRGVLWGIGRLSQARPALVRGDRELIFPYLGSADAPVRGHAAWVLGLLEAQDARQALETLLGDTGRLDIYMDRRLVTLEVRDLAVQALGRMGTSARPDRFSS